MALLKKDDYVLYAGGNADLQTVIYGSTKWADIDFGKSMMLRYTVGDTVVCSAVYTATDLALKFYVDIENDVYVVQLLKSGDEWSATLVDSSSVYEAPWGLSLRLLNTVPTGAFVYTKNGSDVYLNSYRSDTEWRFTQIDGDLIHEAVVTAQAWTVNTHSIGGGSGDNDKVSAAYGTTPGYLSEVLKADTDNVELKTVGNEVRIGLNLTGESDPKLKTVDESLIDANTSNYGSYWGDMPEWGGTNVNVMAYRGKRTSDAQGSLTRVRFALTGSFGSSNPIFRVGVFSLDGTLLGSSDTMRFDGTNFVGQEHGDTMEVPSDRMTDGDIPLHEESVGSLAIRRNTRYVVELVWCGLQFAAKTQSGNGITSNYAFDYTLENNIQTTYTGLKWWDGSSGKQQAQFVPYLSFGAADIGG